MTEQKEDMIVLWVKSVLYAALIAFALYFANYAAFECIAAKGGSAAWLVAHILAFLGLIAGSLILILRVCGLCMDLCINRSSKMFSGAADIFAWPAAFVLSFAVVHLVNIFGGWKFADWGIGILTSREVVIFSLLFSTIAVLLDLLFERLSKKGRKR